MLHELKPGQTGEAALTVQKSDLASEMSITEEDHSPPVFATTRMIVLMEWAASRMMNALLKPGELSVGVGFNIIHLAATLPGQQVRAIATFVKQENKLYHFKVEAYDSAGLIGKGEHTRAIANIERLLNRAQKRFERE